MLTTQAINNTNMAKCKQNFKTLGDCLRTIIELHSQLVLSTESDGFLVTSVYILVIRLITAVVILYDSTSVVSTVDAAAKRY